VTLNKDILEPEVQKDENSTPEETKIDEVKALPTFSADQGPLEDFGEVELHLENLWQPIV
jgi:hypothetical protein